VGDGLLVAVAGRVEPVGLGECDVVTIPLDRMISRLDDAGTILDRIG
jgi:hypothetical protein